MVLKWIKTCEIFKMKLNLKLLIASVLINAVNFNTSYCAEYGAELKQIYNCYIDAMQDNSAYTQNKQIISFCDVLFKNDGASLENNILLLDNNTLINISDLLYKDNARKYLINLLKNKKTLYDKLSDIINNNQSNNIYVTGVLKVIKECRDIVTQLQALNMDILFKEIYFSYIDRESKKEEKHILIKKFWEGLFGDGGNNLEKILDYNNQNELYYIGNMLNSVDSTKKYSVNLLKNNENLYNTVSSIVNRIKKANSNSAQNIINHIRCAILMCKLDMDVDFKTICHNYKHATTLDQKQKISKKICESLFRNKCDNLKTILSDNYKIECSYINTIFDEFDEIEIQFLKNLLQKLDLDSFNEVKEIINTPEKSNYNCNIIDKIKNCIFAVDASKLISNNVAVQTDNNSIDSDDEDDIVYLQDNISIKSSSDDVRDNDSTGSDSEDVCEYSDTDDINNNKINVGKQFIGYNIAPYSDEYDMENVVEQWHDDSQDSNHYYVYKYLDNDNNFNMYNNLETYVNKKLNDIKYLKNNIRNVRHFKYRTGEIF